MRTLKSLFAGVVAGALAVVMATSAMAAGTGSYADGVASVEYDTNAGTQYSVLLIKASVWERVDENNPITAEDIYYINQFDGEASVLNGMGVKTDLPLDVDSNGVAQDTTYKVLVASESLEQIVDFDILIEAPEAPPADPHLVGDVNGSKAVDISDLTDLSNYIANPVLNALKDYDCVDAADVNGSAAVDISDMTDLSNYIANPVTNAFKFTYTNQKAEDEHVPQN